MVGLGEDSVCTPFLFKDNIWTIQHSQHDHASAEVESTERTMI
jgi:hypothetical protein